MGLFGFTTARELENINSTHNMYEHINNNPINYPYLGVGGRDYTTNPTTELEDKYLAMDGYTQISNVPTKTFKYPERLINRYLNGIKTVKENITLNVSLYGELNEEHIKGLVNDIISNNYLIGSEVFVEILNDLDISDIIDEKIKEEVLPKLDFYKNFTLGKYFSDENINWEYANNHREEVNTLIVKYSYLKEFYDKEVENTKDLYKELFLRICFYVYMIKFVQIPHAEKREDIELANRVNRIRNRIRAEHVIDDSTALKLEDEVEQYFLSVINMGRHQTKKLNKLLGPYRDR